MRTLRIPPGETSSEKSRQFALACIGNCTQNHTSLCGEGLAKPFPNRILYVGTLDNPTVRLCESLPGSSRYVCLSHCWGSPNDASSVCRTTIKTLEAFKREIQWSDLPKSFQDAIDFVRRIGLEYCWIDSLCIIQDDRADWAHEAGQMAKIYSNAYLTLAATASSNPFGGCYSTPDISKIYQAREISPSLSNRGISERKPIYARFKPAHIGQYNEFEKFPLLHRAWVVQVCI